MASLGNVVTSITREMILPKVVDNFYSGNALFMRLRNNNRKQWTSGNQIKIPTELVQRTQGGSYFGFDTFNTAQEDVRQQFAIDPAQYYWTATLSGIQVAANKGKEAIVNLMMAEFESIGKAMVDAMGTDLYQDGTGNSGKDFKGLIYHVDDSTNITTYQNLSRSTYAKLKSTLTAQSGSLSLADLAADIDAAQVGNDTPTIGITTPAVFTIYEALMTPTTVHNFNPGGNRLRLTATGIENAGITGNAGFTGLMFRGTPIITDEKCTSGNLYFLNEKYLSMYELAPSSEFVAGSKEGFGWTGWKKPTNQDAITSQILWYGQLVGTEPRKHSRRTGITS